MILSVFSQEKNVSPDAQEPGVDIEGEMRQGTGFQSRTTQEHGVTSPPAETRWVNRPDRTCGPDGRCSLTAPSLLLLALLFLLSLT